MAHDYDATRRSWNTATRNHNAHKGDQAARLRSGEDPLFPEELELLAELRGRDLLHLQCNAGQDTLGLARRGARCVGVDFSDEAISFARTLSAESGIPAEFELGEAVSFLERTERRFDLVFTSYGASPWLPDLTPWAHGIRRVLKPGGAFVTVEFHPLVWSFDADGALRKDDYFHRGPYVEPVSDYVAESGEPLGLVSRGVTVENTTPAYSYTHRLDELVTSLLGAGLRLDTLREWPYANGAKVNPALVRDGRRFVWPPGWARAPLMFGVRATSP